MTTNGDRTPPVWPVTVSAVMPNARGSASSTPRIIPLRIKTTEPMTQRSSAVIWTRVREFRRRKLYAYYRLIYDGSKDVSSAWCDWALATVKIRPESRKCMISKRIPCFWCPRRVKDRTLREPDIRDLFFVPPEVMSQFVEVGNLNFAEKHGPLVLCCSSQGI